MIVKIGENFYDSNQEPIMLIFEEYEKEYLRDIGNQTKYCSFPEDYEIKKINSFMDNVPQEILDKIDY